MDVDGLFVLVEGLVIAEQLQQLASRVDTARSRGQVAKDLELGRGQADPPRTALDPPPLEVDQQVTMTDHATTRGVGQVAVRPAQQRLDPAHQLAQPERLGQVIVGPELETDDLVHLVVPGGQHEDRHLGAGRPQPAEDLEPVHPGQADVEDDEIRCLVGRDVQPLFAGTGHGHFVAFLLEGVLDPSRDGVLVFDDQDGGGHRAMLHRVARTPRRPCPLCSTTHGKVGALPGASPHPAPAGEPQPATQHRTSIEVSNMATARATLAAQHRDVIGKKVGLLRKAGKLPAVVYGRGIESDSVTVDAHEFEQLRRHVGPNALVDLSVDGDKARPVLVHGVQVHPVNRRTLHVDLFLVRMTEELTVDVSLVATGEAPAVALNGGTLLHPIESVRVRALPDHLPQSIEYSVVSLVDFDTALHVRDLTVPSDVTLLTDGDEIIAKVQPPRVEEEPVVVAEAEGAEGEEAAEGEGAGESSDSGGAAGGSTEDAEG